MLVTQGSQTHGQTMPTRRRLAAGDVQTQRRCGIRPPATKWMAEAIYVKLGVSRIEWWWWLRCGCQCSGEVELIAGVILEAQDQLLRGLHGAVKSLYMVVCPLGGRSIIGDELRRRHLR